MSLLVHVVEAINKSIASRPLSLFRGHLNLPRRLGHQGTRKFLVTLIPFSTKELLHEGWGLHVPCTKLSTPLHTKPEDRRHADEPSKLQGAGAPRYKLE